MLHVHCILTRDIDIASAVYAVMRCLSVCLSVCPSVCLLFRDQGYEVNVLLAVRLCVRPTALKIAISKSLNPLIATLKLQSNGPSYSNTVIGTLAIVGWYSEEGPGRAAAPPKFVCDLLNGVISNDLDLDSKVTGLPSTNYDARSVCDSSQFFYRTVLVLRVSNISTKFRRCHLLWER